MTLTEKLKLIFKVRKPATDLIEGLKEIKRGYKTFSFWASITATLVTLIGVIAGFLPGQLGVILVTVVGALYNIVRGLKKAEEDGIRPTLRTTEFWVGIGAILSTLFLDLQNAGVTAPWVAAASGFLATIMSVSQNLGSNQPKNEPTTPPQN